MEVKGRNVICTTLLLYKVSKISKTLAYDTLAAIITIKYTISPKLNKWVGVLENKHAVHPMYYIIFKSGKYIVAV